MSAATPIPVILFALLIALASASAAGSGKTPSRVSGYGTIPVVFLSNSDHGSETRFTARGFGYAFSLSTGGDGYTSSTAFPVTPGAVQPTFAGGPLDGYVASIQ